MRRDGLEIFLWITVQSSAVIARKEVHCMPCMHCMSMYAYPPEVDEKKVKLGRCNKNCVMQLTD